MTRQSAVHCANGAKMSLTLPALDPALDLPDADVVLVVPPFAHLTWPALGVETLAAIARRAGFSVHVLYGNLHYAAQIGAVNYASLANAPGDWLLGERLFARKAYRRDALSHPDFLARVRAHDVEAGQRAHQYLDHMSDGTGLIPEAWGAMYPEADLLRYRDAAEGWVDALGPALAGKYRIIGVTTSFEQTSAAYALLASAKASNPSVATLVGGANCDGPLGAAVKSLGPAIDVVFSGESESSFLAYLQGQLGDASVAQGEPCRDLDALPTPDYDSWFQQLDRHVPELRDVPLWLTYESSRGCWWGQKHHCTFCGLNANGMAYRHRAPERVIADLQAWLQRYPTRYVAMTDNIMPHSYHRHLMPALAASSLNAHIFYEQKANLTLAQVRGLHEAGVKVIQPGIESLSTSLLARMRKGVTAKQNIALLRYCASVGVIVKWNLLHNFPGDDADDYREMLELVPLLHHLIPPNALVHLSIDRFSPYFDEPDRYGITEITPLAAYAEVFPDHVDPAALAYHFTATWSSGSTDNPALMGQLWAAVQRWRAAWESSSPPVLRLARAGAGYVLTDTRGTGPSTVRLTEAQAVAVAAGGPLDAPAGQWAMRRGYAIARDDWAVPLATAHPDLLAALEARPRTTSAAITRLEAS